MKSTKTARSGGAAAASERASARRFLFAGDPLLVLALALALAGVLVSVAAAAARPPASDDPAKVDYGWVPEMAPDATEFPAPPADKWMVDEQGNEYSLYKWRKHPGYYTWVDEAQGLVKLRHTMVMQVEHHDDEFFYFRQYRTGPIEERLAADRRRREEETAALAATYRTEIETRDELRLVPWDEGLPKNYQWRNGLAIADMNGDGHLDIVHGPPRKGPIPHPAIFLGDGAGNWRYWEEAKFPLLPYDYGDVDVGDLDGDGHLDLVLGAHLTGIMALVGDGKGGFESWSNGLPLRRSAQLRLAELEKAQERAGRPEPPRAPRRLPPTPGKQTTTVDPTLPQLGPDGEPLEPPAEPPAFTSRALALVDWNGDGRLDILAISEGPTSIKDITDGVAPPLGKIVFLNRGDGSWEALTGPGHLLGDAVRVVDLDRDGRLDFVTDSGMIGNGQIVNRGAGESWEALAIPDPRRRLLVQGVAVDDFDGDGRPDLALAYQSQDAKVRRGIDVYFQVAQASGTATADAAAGGASTAGASLAWRRESIFATDKTETEGLQRVAAGDLDGDGDADLVALTAEGKVWVFLNDGKGGFVREATPEVDPQRDHLFCSGYHAEIVDLDGDGRNELIASFAGEVGSELLIGESGRCKAGGSLRVWKVEAGVAPVVSSDTAAAPPRPGDP